MESGTQLGVCMGRQQRSALKSDIQMDLACERTTAIYDTRVAVTD